jgi:hypothetical protein
MVSELVSIPIAAPPRPPIKAPVPAEPAIAPMAAPVPAPKSPPDKPRSPGVVPQPARETPQTRIGTKTKFRMRADISLSLFLASDSHASFNPAARQIVPTQFAGKFDGIVREKRLQ